MKTFTVSRKKWFRGKGPSASKLRRHDGAQCCLGYAARCLSIRAKDILNINMPYDLELELANKFPHLNDTTEWGMFARINDDMTITNLERETKLKALAKENGFRFKFVP